jgi:hypothetical protein
MSGGDGMGFSTRVPISRHAWVSAVTSYPVLNWSRFSRILALRSLARGTGNSRAWLAEGGVRDELGHKVEPE